MKLIAVIIHIHFVIHVLWTKQVISAAINAEVPQECRLSLPADYAKMTPPVQMVIFFIIFLITDECVLHELVQP